MLETVSEPSLARCGLWVCSRAGAMERHLLIAVVPAWVLEVASKPISGACRGARVLGLIVGPEEQAFVFTLEQFEHR